VSADKRIAFVLAGCSGSGKSTLLQQVFKFAGRQRENFSMHKTHSLKIDETAWHSALEANYATIAIAYRLTPVLLGRD
jgi:ABC-type transport system involved in cytochrome bd biosynthesis fused ATPase/permease subunit